MGSRRKALIVIIVAAISVIVIGIGQWRFPERVQQAAQLFSSESIVLLVDLLRSLGWIGPLGVCPMNIIFCIPTQFNE